MRAHWQVRSASDAAARIRAIAQGRGGKRQGVKASRQPQTVQKTWSGRRAARLFKKTWRVAGDGSAKR